MHRCITVSFAVVLIALYGSCGIEDTKYIAPVTGVRPTLNTSATVTLPSPHSGEIVISFSPQNFPSITISGISMADFKSHYEIYYRIYVSDHSSSDAKTDLNTVNPALSADYKSIEPSTVAANNDTKGSSIFTNRKYCLLGFDGSNRLTRFSTGSFTLKPDAYFLNSADLNTTTPTTTLNNDVQMKDNIAQGAQRYTYVSMYILGVDFNDQNLNSVYSYPSFINVFRLPESTDVR